MENKDRMELESLLYDYRTAVRMHTWAKLGTAEEKHWHLEMTRLHQAIADHADEIGNKMWNAALEETA